VRIGEVAQRSGVPVKTIRYYEDIGVLDPPQRTASGYRDYDDNVIERLAFVRSAQTVGLKLGEIREIVAFHARGETPCAHVVALIAHRSAELSRRIAELERMKAELSRLARRARSLDPRDCHPSQVCHIIGPAR
jgi:DNA-binding transcriptional MerR regulator